MQKKKASSIPPKLTEAEQNLLAHMEQGYQLETDSLGGNPIRRRPGASCDNETPLCAEGTGRRGGSKSLRRLCED
jgi:hypothetical protein